MEMKPFVKVHPVIFGIIVAAIAILLSVIVLQQSGLRITAGAPAVRAAASATAQPAAHKQLYISVMHPWIVQDHPGTCPICGMELVKMDPVQQVEYLKTHPNV